MLVVLILLAARQEAARRGTVAQRGSQARGNGNRRGIRNGLPGRPRLHEDCYDQKHTWSISSAAQPYLMHELRGI